MRSRCARLTSRALRPTPRDQRCTRPTRSALRPVPQHLRDADSREWKRIDHDNDSTLQGNTEGAPQGVVVPSRKIGRCHFVVTWTQDTPGRDSPGASSVAAACSLTAGTLALGQETARESAGAVVRVEVDVELLRVRQQRRQRSGVIREVRVRHEQAFLHKRQVLVGEVEVRPDRR